LKNLNIDNTMVNLSSDYEQLKQENRDLLNIIEETKTAQEEGVLMLPTQFITTPEQADEAIQKHLKKIEKEWREYFANPEEALPIIETQTSGDYQRLVDKWNAGSEYNADYDFDGSLDKLIQLLKNITQKLMNNIETNKTPEITEQKGLSEEYEAPVPETLQKEDKDKLKDYEDKEDLEEKQKKTEEELNARIQELEVDLKTVQQEKETILTTSQQKEQELAGKLKEWRENFNDLDLEEVKNERQTLKESQLRIRRYAQSNPVLTIKDAREAIAELLEQTENNLGEYFDVKCLVNHGKVAIVNFGGRLLLAQIVEGYENQAGDQDKSKKRLMVEFERDPGKDGWKDPMNSYESGFVGVVAPKQATNQIKKWEYLVARDNTAERKQLWQDLREVE
ncbi:7914_t:CDS:2, partial [Funneliformis geosporum]